MSIENAAASLADKLREKSWFTTVGMGEHDGSPALFLYVSKIVRRNLRFWRTVGMAIMLR